MSSERELIEALMEMDMKALKLLREAEPALLNIVNRLLKEDVETRQLFLIDLILYLQRELMLTPIEFYGVIESVKQNFTYNLYKQKDKVLELIAKSSNKSNYVR